MLDKMYKYEMDPTKTVGVTEWTRDAGQTDGQTDRRTDERTEWNQYTPQQLRCAEGIIIAISGCKIELIKLDGAANMPTLLVIDAHMPQCFLHLLDTINEETHWGPFH